MLMTRTARRLLTSFLADRGGQRDGIAVTFWTSNARFMLAKEATLTGIVGLVIGISVTAGRLLDGVGFRPPPDGTFRTINIRFPDHVESGRFILGQWGG
jgi:hypothetical protein